jgi:diadenylate cyclase
METMRLYLQQTPVSLWDLLDVAIVAVALYEFMKLIRGTVAVQMGVGSGIIVLLFAISQWAPLQTVSWLIQNTFGYVVFAAIVIFQADIRRALAHFGNAPVFQYLSRAEEVDEAIEELTVAATLLADKRIGAIMVVERAIGLRNYVESGIPLEATVTHDLIVSIFQTSSPLHDGAVIVQERRIAAAACFLPLTVNPQLSRELGTRHRAAIGVTEETDALAIVVSEETGKISLALEGRIERGLTGDQLRARLNALVHDGRKRRPRGGAPEGS